MNRTQKLNEAAVELGVELRDAVMTQLRDKLVYVVVSGGRAAIYASAQSSLGEFAPGGAIEGVRSAEDEIEPWIDATCSKLYFRRGSPNAAGQILVAE